MKKPVAGFMFGNVVEFAQSGTIEIGLSLLVSLMLVVAFEVGYEIVTRLVQSQKEEV